MAPLLLLGLAALAAGNPAEGGTTGPGGIVPVPRPRPASRVALAQERALSALADKAKQHLAAAGAMLEILQDDLGDAEARGLKFEKLYESGLVSRQERDRAAEDIRELQLEVNRQQEICSSTRLLLVELTEAASLELGSPSPAHGEESRPWDVSLIPELANFFWHRFGRELPISALGQTPTHEELGFDHRDRVDLALRPGSPEGQAVIEFLTLRRLPFQAFSASRLGSATGAHIHVGPVSDRLR